MQIRLIIKILGETDSDRTLALKTLPALIAFFVLADKLVWPSTNALIINYSVLLPLIKLIFTFTVKTLVKKLINSSNAWLSTVGLASPLTHTKKSV